MGGKKKKKKQALALGMKCEIGQKNPQVSGVAEKLHIENCRFRCVFKAMWEVWIACFLQELNVISFCFKKSY